MHTSIMHTSINRKYQLHLLKFPFHEALLEVLGHWCNLPHDTSHKQVEIENHTFYRSIYCYDTAFSTSSEQLQQIILSSASGAIGVLKGIGWYCPSEFNCQP